MIANFLKLLLPSKTFLYLKVFYYSLKNELTYLETHITNHCNLNCSACRHFSPLSGESFRDLNLFKKDMERMQELFSNVRVIRLMGGEPLLHPNVSDFLTITRKAFPRAEIHLATNGILLSKMNIGFWKSCSSAKIILDVTRYLKGSDFSRIRQVTLEYGVTMNESPLVTKFHKYHMNREGNSNIEKTFNACRNQSYCPFLDSDKGRLYTCAVSATASIYSEHFQDKLNTSDRDYISIYGNLTSRDIFKFLSSSVPFCRYCTTKKTLFDWSLSRLTKEEWFD